MKKIDDSILHLAVHITFICSLRSCETAGIDIKTIDFWDRSLWISQEIQRASDEALKVIPEDEIIKIFPKEVPTSKTNLVTKFLKTDGSYRKIFLTTPLMQEIKERLKEIERNKAFFGTE